MATLNVKVSVCDVCGRQDGITRIGIVHDSRRYNGDLCAEHLAPVLEVAHRFKGGPRRRLGLDAIPVVSIEEAKRQADEARKAAEKAPRKGVRTPAGGTSVAAKPSRAGKTATGA